MNSKLTYKISPVERAFFIETFKNVPILREIKAESRFFARIIILGLPVRTNLGLSQGHDLDFILILFLISPTQYIL